MEESCDDKAENMLMGSNLVFGLTNNPFKRSKATTAESYIDSSRLGAGDVGLRYLVTALNRLDADVDATVDGGGRW